MNAYVSDSHSKSVSKENLWTESWINIFNSVQKLAAWVCLENGGRNKKKLNLKMNTKVRNKILMPLKRKMKMRKSGIREQSRGDEV